MAILNLPISDLIKVSAGLFGLIFGIIFLSDGWYSTSETTGFLGNSPKIRGLLFLLGGSVIPVFTDLFSPAGEEARGYATVFYAAVLGMTTVGGVALLAIYAFIVSASRIHDLVPTRWWLKICIDALPFVFLAVRKGSAIYEEELNRRLDKLKKLSGQRDSTLILFNAIYAAMVDNNINHIQGIKSFIDFVDAYLEHFIENFLSSEKDDATYRACIYFHDKNKEVQADGDSKLFYLTGVDPTGRKKFSKRILNSQESFAGWVINHSLDSNKVYSYVRGEKNVFESNEAISFETQNPAGPYQSVVSCAIQPLAKTHGTYPSLVLCIDCSKASLGIFSVQSEDKAYIESVLVFLCTAFATAQASMGVLSSGDNGNNEDSESIARWIKHKYYVSS